MLPKELEDLFDEYTDDDYNLYVAKVDNTATNFLLDFVLDVQDINDKGAITQNWQIEVVGHRKKQISFDDAPFIEIKSDHPLLWEFTDTQCQLYFNGQCKDPAKLFYDLYVTHKQTLGAYQCFDISFGESIAYYKSFQYTNGLLTKGAKKLMLKYGQSLERNGLSYTLLGEREPTYWNGSQYVSERKDLQVLLMGKTYIIAEDFRFIKQEEASR